MIDIEEVRSGMSVISSDGGHIAVIDDVDGDASISLARDNAGVHHVMPVTWITSVCNGQIIIDRSGARAMIDWWSSPGDAALV